MKYLFRFLLIALIAVACEEVYTIPPRSQVQLNLYNMETQGARTTLISAIGLGQDSVFISANNSSTILLPLDPEGITTYVLLLDSVADTIQFVHSSEMVYESMESGFYYTYNLQGLGMSLHKIDSVSVLDTIVNANWHENIQLFLNDSTHFSSDNAE